MSDATKPPQEIPALKVHQWLPEWNEVEWNSKAHQGKPEPDFYLFTMSASALRRLSAVHRRSAAHGSKRSSDLGIQRYSDKERSAKIREFVHYGYPWSDLSTSQRASSKFSDLRKPGWIPTAIIVNILRPGDIRGGASISADDAILVEEHTNGSVLLRLPEASTDETWSPELAPIEVIDGQHRLLAFADGSLDADFQLPVVAFHGLDISWQAYLFWNINITPKRINASMAFDLIPLLRSEEWLDRFFGHKIYRETRAQELVEALWLHTESPWRNRINMLGEPGRISGDKRPMVSQAAWVRSLMATYVKSWEASGIRIGGLFGAPMGDDETVLPWIRTQQAAYLLNPAGRRVTRSCEDAH